jgi:hypothetical protein
MEQLEAVSAVLAEHPDSRPLLINPAFPPERREAFLDELGGVLGLDARVRSFLGLLVEDDDLLGGVGEQREKRLIPGVE